MQILPKILNLRICPSHSTVYDLYLYILYNSGENT